MLSIDTYATGIDTGGLTQHLAFLMLGIDTYAIVSIPRAFVSKSHVF